MPQICFFSNSIFVACSWFTRINTQKCNFELNCLYTCPPIIRKNHKNMLKGPKTWFSLAWNFCDQTDQRTFPCCVCLCLYRCPHTVRSDGRGLSKPLSFKHSPSLWGAFKLSHYITWGVLSQPKVSQWTIPLPEFMLCSEEEAGETKQRKSLQYFFFFWGGNGRKMYCNIVSVAEKIYCGLIRNVN